MNRFVLAAFLAIAGCAAVPPPASADFDVIDYYSPSEAPVFYTATSGQTAFTIPWAFEFTSEIVVMTTLDDIEEDATVSWSTRTLSTDYTISGAGGNSGTLTFNSGGCEAGNGDAGTGCTLGTTVLIYRDVDPERTDDFGATISSETLNRNFDRQAMWTQEAKNILMRQSLKLPITDYQKDVELPPMTPAVAGFAVVVNTNADGFEYEANEAGEVVDTICPTAYSAADRLLKSANTSCGTATTGCSVSGTNSDSVSCPGSFTGTNFTASGYHEATLGLRANNGSPLRLREAIASTGDEYTDILSITDQPHTSLVYWPDDVPAVNEGLRIASVSGSGPYTIELDWGVPQTESPPYDIAMWQPGFPTDGQFIAGHVFDRAVTCADDFSGSQAKFSANFAADKVYDIYKNTSDIGDMACLTGASTCSFITGAIGTTSFAAGDTIRIYAPATVDTTARDMMVTFKCTR